MAVILDNLELDEDLKKLKQVRGLCLTVQTLTRFRFIWAVCMFSVSANATQQLINLPSLLMLRGARCCTGKEWFLKKFLCCTVKKVSSPAWISVSLTSTHPRPWRTTKSSRGTVGLRRCSSLIIPLAIQPGTHTHTHCVNRPPKTSVEDLSPSKSLLLVYCGVCSSLSYTMLRCFTMLWSQH